mgnify:CR=1 FL=1
MSRTGNLLFPDSEDDGWVTSIIKALPEEKPKDDAPVTDDIEDPVAIEAEAEADGGDDGGAATDVGRRSQSAGYIEGTAGPLGPNRPIRLARKPRLQVA